MTRSLSAGCGLHLRDGPNRKSFAVEDHRVWQVTKRLVSAVGVTRRRLDTGKLDGEGSLGLACERLGSGVKGDGPVVDICVVRIWTDGIGLATKYTPVDVVEVSGNVARAHVEVDTVGEVLWEIVDGPVEAVLIWCVGAGGVSCLAMTELTTAAVRSADAPELRASRLGDPSRSCLCGSTRFYDHAILCVLTENTTAVDGQAIRSSLDARQRNSAISPNITPVLI